MNKEERVIIIPHSTTRSELYSRVRLPLSHARVLIIESLSPLDLTRRWSEAAATERVLQTLGVETLFHEARSKSDFEAGCGMFSSGSFDVLHLACHGCENHLCLSDGTEITWNTLSNLLGQSMDNKHLVLSACRGGCPRAPAIFETLPIKPQVIIGPRTDVPWPDLVVAWQVYYKAVFPCNNIGDNPCIATSRVKLATGVDLVCHQLEEGKYVRYEPNAGCAAEVHYQAFPEERVKKQHANASS